MRVQTTWKADSNHSKLTFSTVHHSIADIAGLFKKFEITIVTNKTDFNDAEFELSTDVSGIDTEVELRDNHLRSADFFDVEKFSQMTFKSMSIKKLGKDKYKHTGTLILHGIANRQQLIYGKEEL